MLYLAEVQKKTGVFGAGGKAELKLLACQRGEQWSAVAGEETIAADEASNFKDGALVLVELSASKQVQRPPQEAGRPLVGILQGFSRAQDKFKGQQEEIEQWKQSLTYQAQELNRREMEIYAREEQLAKLEEEAENLEQQRQACEQAREEAERLKEEILSNRQELEGAWEHLRGEQRRLEEKTDQLNHASVLDEAQAQQIQESLNRLAGAIAPTDSMRDSLNRAVELANVQQQVMEGHWQQLEQQRQSAEQLQAEVERIDRELSSRSSEWQQAQTLLEQARSELRIQQSSLTVKQDYASALGITLRNTEELYQRICVLAESSDQVSITLKIDIEALEKMPLDELQVMVRDLQADLDKASRFVRDQEEELELQRQAIDEIQQKIEQASEYDRLSLETELSNEQESYQMLNESLVGSRRNLREREEILKQHEGVLRRRQGLPMEPGQEKPIDLAPVVEQLEAQRQAQTAELQKLEGEISQMREAIQQAESLVNTQVGEQETKRNELKQLETTLAEQRVAAAQAQAKVALYQEVLQALQDRINEQRDTLEAMNQSIAQIQETGDYQLSAIAQMRQTVMSLVNQSGAELAAS
ncbi:hypothetical protein H6G20_23790 [Desertifilum sp. FACHB-1129]|uniref:Uncharacterized protein n=1 Tax=Desertifilum tharense IPPAS B-1220 TaxID=1781255 RepID=A0A1E5QH28_9CYAN|nr:pilus motility taxis protein HmpF [Desertifilum tharense]MBD2314694.1 hypothetical protein [Desertifilum sp. FACHB-1129]MBD2325133.1 hypothetical protein [Desertifilum sp. FACHB-866]MBD2330173.1 hypothetical protein [Desertifilum sp. FACHB-868]MDA0211185.1 pilus motility taxis protein HmpF [Cyanobacteria bacterium FC1]OEJ73992.1 hypothetical protein BH720_16965 [Desertifilum tharense IPPAS B-1220]